MEDQIKLVETQLSFKIILLKFLYGCYILRTCYRKINLKNKMFAWVVISIAKLAFLVQYYALICFLIVKNLFQRVFSKKDEKKQSIFSHPQHSVHPHILLSTRTFLHKKDDFIKHEEFTLETYECPTEDGAYATLWRIRHGDL